MNQLHWRVDLVCQADVSSIITLKFNSIGTEIKQNTNFENNAVMEQVYFIKCLFVSIMYGYKIRQIHYAIKQHVKLWMNLLLRRHHISLHDMVQAWL